MFDFLAKPYPAHSRSKKGFYISIGTGLFVGLFLLLLQPFDLDDLRSPYKSIMILGYGVISFIVVYFFNQILPSLFPLVSDDKRWTVGKEIIYLNALILSIAMANTLYTPFLSPSNQLTLGAFGLMIVNTFLVGIIPSIFFVIIDYSVLDKRYVSESQAIKLKADLSQIPASKSLLKITTSQEEIQLHPENLLYIESDGNYAQVVCCEESNVKKDLYRSTLKHLDENIPDPNIIRCHRSYMVNLDQVKAISGNAQGFKLTLHNCEEIVPVSRKYVPIVKNFFAEKNGTDQ